MSAQENEIELMRLFAPGTRFVFTDGIEYVSQICTKPRPQTPGGEPITDVYIDALSTTNKDHLILKISLKKIGWEFIKNHMQENDFTDIFFDDPEEQIQFYQNQSVQLLQNVPVIDLGIGNKINARMGNGSMTLGWEMMITNRTRSLSLGVLPPRYVREAILGENMEERRRHALVNGKVINNSGIPTHVLEMNIDQNTTANDVFQTMVTSDEFVEEQQDNLHLILKANNYRSLSDKSSSGRCDGTRYLFVQNSWNLSENNCLSRQLDTEHPFGENNPVRQSLENALERLGIDIRNVTLDMIPLCDGVTLNNN